MSSKTDKKNHSKLYEAYNEPLKKENLEAFSYLIENNSPKNFNKFYFIIRRNLKNFNFSNVLSEEKIQDLRINLSEISNKILNTLPGKILESDSLDLLNNSNFTLVLDEIKEFSNRKIFAYLNNNDSILALFNGEDQIKLILCLDNPKNLEEEYSNFYKIQELISSYSNFNGYFGYLTSNPCNSGSGLEIRMNFKNLEKNHSDELKKAAKEYQLSRYSNLSTSSDVYNKIKACYGSNEIFENIVKFIEKIGEKKFSEKNQEVKTEEVEKVNVEKKEENDILIE